MGRPLNTAAALDFVTKNVFIPAAGSRRDAGAAQILVLITAGKSRNNVGPAAEAMRQAGIVPIVVGAKNAVRSELQQITSDPDSVFKLNTFQELPTIQQQLLSKAQPVHVIEEPIIIISEVVPKEMSERDIVFLIDGSDNVGDANLPHVRDFIIRIIQHLAIGRNKVRVGLAQYSDDTDAEFYLNTYSSEAELLSHVRSLGLRGGATANTGSALDFAIKYYFTSSAGSRIKENIPQFLLLITGGRSSDDVEEAADALKRAAVMTFAIGVKNADPAQLEEMAIDPSLIFNVKEFHFLPDVVNQLITPLTMLSVPTVVIEEPTAPIEEPTASPEEEPLTTTEVPRKERKSNMRDIVFLVDGTPGMGRSFPHVREFLMKIVQEFDVGPDTDHIAVVQYSSNPKLEFGLNAHSTRDELLNAVKKLRFKKGKPLNTGAALDFVTRNIFIPAAGSRRDARAAQILVLITAGKSSDNVGPAAEAMRQAGIVLIAIGAKNADTSELQQITSDPDSVFNLVNFEQLSTLSQQLLSKVQPVFVTEEPILPTQEVVQMEMSERDIVFLIDGSDNIGNANLPYVRDFIIRIIQHLAIGHDKVRVGLAQYSDDTEDEFHLNTYSSEAELLSHVKSLSLRGGATANTGSALDFAIKYYFTSSAGSRIKENVPQFLLLITGGRSSDDVEEAADALKRAAVMTFAIGVKNADPAQLEEMAIDPSLIFNVKEFHFLPDVVNQLIMPLTMLSVPTVIIEEPTAVIEEPTAVIEEPTAVIEEPTAVIEETTAKPEEEPLITAEARKSDIVFLIDGSPGMGRSFQQVREFLLRLIQEIDVGPDTDQVAVVQYSSNPRLEFGLNVHSRKDEALNAIRKLKLKTGKPLNTGAALDFVTRNVFVPAAGSRRDAGAAQILVLITAGKSSDDVGPAAEAMRQAGIVPIAVGANRADTSELQQITSDPDSALILGDFKELPTVQLQLLSKVGAVFVIEESIPPTEVVPQEVDRRDIVFLVDGSATTGNVNFVYIRKFIIQLIDKLDIGRDRVQVGLAQYSDGVKTECYLNSYSTKTELVNYLKGLKVKGGRMANTGAALDYVRANHFTKSAGSRKEEGVPQILVLLTGSRSMDDIKSPTDALRKAAIITFVFGARKADIVQLREIASDPNTVLTVKEFQSLLKIQEQVLTRLSTLPTPQLTTEQPIIIIKQVLPKVEGKKDIVFLIDASDNVRDTDFLQLREFLTRIIKNVDIGSDRVQIGLVQYSNYAETEFYLNTYSSEDEIMSHMEGLRQRGGMPLNTGAALDYVLTNHFTRSSGSRKDKGVHQILVLIMAGRSRDYVKQSADALKRAAVTVYAVGTRDVDPAQVKETASDPSLGLNIEDFRSLPNIQEQVMISLSTLPATREPTRQPTVPVRPAEGTIKRDIVFLIDASDNVRDTDFAFAQEFLTLIIENLDIGSDGVQIGLVQYSNYAETEFYLNTYSSEDEIMSHVEGLRQRGGMPLNTGAALDYVLTNHFTRSSGSRKDIGVPQILVLIMAGRSRDYVKQSADALKRAAVTVFAVGTRDVDPAQVKETASDPSLGLNIEDFRSLPNIQEQVMMSLSTLPVTREPTRQPTVPVRPVVPGGASKRDIVFLIDGSDNVGNTNAPFVRDFLTSIIENLDIGSDRVQIGLVQYSNYAETEFYLNTYSSEDEIMSHVEGLRLRGTTTLNTGAALDYVLRNHFTRSSGSRKGDGVPQLLVLITAGRSRDDIKRSAEALKQAAIMILAVGTGSTDPAQLKEMANDPSLVFRVQEFQSLPNVQEQVMTPLTTLTASQVSTESPTVPSKQVLPDEEIKRDIVFLIDGSDNIGNTNFPFVRDFLTNVIQNLNIGSDRIQVGLVQYSTYAETEFYLNTYLSKAEILAHIRRLRLKGGTRLNTGAALDYVFRYHFISSAGSRKQKGIPQFLVVLTSGRSSDDVKPSADAMKRAAIMNFAIGVKNADLMQLKDIAIDPSLVFSSSTFYSLPNIEEEVTTLLLTLPAPRAIPEEPTAPIERVIPDTSKRDIVFLIDGSNNVGSTNVMFVRDFLTSIIENLDIGRSRVQVGLVQYSNYAETEFYLNTYSSEDELLSHVKGLRLRGGTSLNTGAALDYVLRYHFTQSAGSRKEEGVPQILVLITGGRSGGYVRQLEDALKRAAVLTFVIAAKNTDPLQLQEMSIDPGLIFKVQEFSSLPDVQEQLMISLSTLAAPTVVHKQPTVITEGPTGTVTPDPYTTDGKKDIVFLVDESDYVGNSNLAPIRDFISTIIENLDIGSDRVRVGLVLYSNTAETEFYLNTYFRKDELLDFLRTLRFKGGTRLTTGKALDFVLRYHFIRSVGSRREEGIPQFLVLITGGRSGDDIKPAADALKQSAVITLTIGSETADLAHLKEIAFKPNLAFSVRDFYSLPGIQEQVMMSLQRPHAPEIITEEPTVHIGKPVVDSTKASTARKRDIVFLIDTSPGMWASFIQVREFLMKVIQELDVGPDKDQVAVLQYNSNPTLKFGLDSYSTCAQLLNAIKSLRLKKGRLLNTGAALDFVTRNVFIPAAGSRRDAGATQILVLITAGKSRDNVGPAAEAVRQAGIVLIAIGAKNADTLELQQITSDPDSVFKLNDFQELPTIQQWLLSKAQPVPVIEEPIIISEVVQMEMSERDVVFLIDGSDNIGNANLPHVRDFIIRIIQHLAIGRNKVRVGLAQYGDDTEAEFYLNTYSSEAELLSHVKSLSLRGGATANTGSALDFAIKYYFTSSAGSRIKENVPQFLLLITGGRSSDDVDEAADALKRAAVMTFAIGVKNADPAQLEEMAIDPSLIFNVKEFHFLPDVLNQLMMPLTMLSVPTVIEEPTDVEEEMVTTSEARKRDIVFLIDGSSGMGRSFQKVREFLKKVIQELDIGPNKDQVAVVQYSLNSKLEFGLSVHSTKDDILNAVVKLKLKKGRTLNTGAALDFVTKNVFIPAAGSRRDAGAAQILVLITAGKSRDNVGPAAEGVRQAGIVPIAIGANSADTSELQQIVHEPSLVLKLSNFQELPTIEKELISKVKTIVIIEDATAVNTEVLPEEVNKRDIVFLIDGSDNVGSTNLFLVHEFISNIIENLDIGSDRVRVGLAQFSHNTKTEFYLNTYSTKAEILSHVKGLKLKGGPTLNTGAALDFVLRNLFTEDAGGRKEHRVPQFLVLFTGGRSVDDIKPYADALKRAAIATFAVGVGNASLVQLNEIATNPNLVFSVKEFQNLPNVQERVMTPLSTLSAPTVTIRESRVINEEALIPGEIEVTSAEAMRQDIVFLIDGTIGMGKAFPLIRQFLIRVIQELDIGPDKDQVAVVQYSSDAKTEFAFNTYASKDEVLDATTQIRRKTGRVLNTGAALEYVTRNIFTTSAGSRQDAGAKQILVLITAGRSMDDVNSAADIVKQAHIVPIAIGAKNVDPSELRRIAYSPDFLIVLKTFHTIPTFQQRLISMLKSISV
ncbi:collagen alpha-3(VI) chain-like isoform X1 [Pristis pectinata]|uniref:collagen alpha-3(VI) chain-like isoform X1 n=1 Tax=Pristis pectinata TaxID=685728 RepID=UPI00223E0D82|nr:collagen alpha-3(VI) chain-like isoform X1 [Pristis pectinata]